MNTSNVKRSLIMGLFTPVWEKRDADPVKAANAVKKINDEDKLKAIAQTAVVESARKEAVARITDQQFLLEYVFKNKDGSHSASRKTAAMCITSPDLLIKLICYGFPKDDYGGAVLAYEALKKIKNKKLLVKATKAALPEVRWDAIKMLNTDECYEQTVRTDPENAAKAFEYIKDPGRRMKLIDCIEDDYELSKRLGQLADEGQVFDSDTIQKLIDKTDNKKFARHSYPYVVSFIDDAEKLADIALNDKNYHARRTALFKITDDNVLAKIAMNTNEDDSNRAEAYFRLSNKSLVDDIIRKHIETVDARYWSDEDKRIHNLMSSDSY
jgi:hypothetical protein